MRIATANAYDAGIDSLVRRQGELAEMQDKMTSGKRVAKASDDPACRRRAPSGRWRASAATRPASARSRRARW
jgi:flagellar hook-associated protein 3 FlgL